MWLPWWLRNKEPACKAGDTGDKGSIPGSGRYHLEEGMATHSSILACRIPCTEEPWQATVHGVTELDMIEVTEHALTHVRTGIYSFYT